MEKTKSYKARNATINVILMETDGEDNIKEEEFEECNESMNEDEELNGVVPFYPGGSFGRKFDEYNDGLPTMCIEDDSCKDATLCTFPLDTHMRCKNAQTLKLKAHIMKRVKLFLYFQLLYERDPSKLPTYSVLLR